MTRRVRLHVRRIQAVALLALAPVLFVVASGSSSADVATVTGSAFGARGDVTITLFGGTLHLDPTPSVTLPAAGGSQTDTAPSASLASGPADILETGALTVSTQGTTGSTGSVTSTASAQDVGPGPITADSMTSTCTADESGVTGSAQIANGVVVTDDVDPDNDTDDIKVQVPPNPPPNTSYTGILRGVGNDTFRVVFNEQVVTAGSITVNAMHLIATGPIALGDVFVGHSVCGVSTEAATTSTSSSTSTTSTSTTSSTSSTSTTSTSTSTTLPPGDTSGGGTSGGSTSGGGQSALARTGSALRQPLVLSMMSLLLGVLFLRGFSGGPASAGAGAGNRWGAATWPTTRGAGGVQRLLRGALATATRRFGRRHSPWKRRWW